MPYTYHLEHLSRGVLMQLPIESDDAQDHWSWSKPRNEARQFKTQEQAQAAYNSLPLKRQRGVYIMERRGNGNYYEVWNPWTGGPRPSPGEQAERL